MTVTAKCLIEAKYAANSDTVEYTCPAGVHTIIDKFTGTNIDGSTHTLNVNIVPSGGTVGASNLIADAVVIVTTATYDASELQNHILNPGDQISVSASAASFIVIRASGREVT